MVETMFTDILDKDERIVKTYKPNKKKFFAGVSWLTFFSSFWLLCVLFAAIPDEGEIFDPWLLLWLGIGIVGAFAVIWLSVYILARSYYKNMVYAYTDKRIIVRTGIFGVTYTSIELKSITVVSVKISLLDKIIGKNTGMIVLASSMPLLACVMKHIDDPYKVIKEIKDYCKI